jgi:hypothetical protein
VRQGVEDTEMGLNLHEPIFHPIVQNPPKSAVLGLASMNHLVDRIAKVKLYIVHRTMQYGQLNTAKLMNTCAPLSL